MPVKERMTFSTFPVVLGETTGTNGGVFGVTILGQFRFRLLMKFVTGGTHDVLCRYALVTH